MKPFFLLPCIAALFATFSVESNAQTVITGTLIDAATQEPVRGARVQIVRADSSLVAGAIAGQNGTFSVQVHAPQGSYTLLVQSVAFAAFRKTFLLTSNDTLRLGTLRLTSAAVRTKEVDVTALAERVAVKGDTTELNAGAYKTDKNADAETLIKKMPGVEVDPSGTVKAQGENVRRVLVDGKPFFGDDPTLALRNLPAEVIDKVQIIDQLSDQAQFTRFDDGNRDKVINIVTRANRRAGVFGKVFAGGGAGIDAGGAVRYSAGGSVNFFNGDRRISIIGMSNNINQQNFAIQDIVGAMGSGGSGGGGAGGGMRQAAMQGAGAPGGGGRGGGGGGGYQGGGGSSAAANFLVPQSSGISTSHALGLNFSDTWDKTLQVTASYFVNYTNNASDQAIAREYFLTGGTSQFARQNDTSGTTNVNHRFNARLEWTIDSSNSIIWTPRLTAQMNDRERFSTGNTRNSAFELLNTSQNLTSNVSNGVNIGQDLLWRHRFDTTGRTLSVNLSASLSPNNGKATNNAVNAFYNADDSSHATLPPSLPLPTLVDSLLQETPFSTQNTNLGVNVAYTEPLGVGGMLQAQYNGSWTHASSDRRTFDYSRASGEYTALNTLLSNISESDYTTHRPGVSYRYSWATGANFSVGVNYQIATLSVDQTYPRALELSRTFNNLLPTASLAIRFAEQLPDTNATDDRPARRQSTNLRLNYRVGTNQPSISQLQDVINNADPLRLTTGNPSLRQEFTHSLTANIGSVNQQTASSLFAVVSGNYTFDKIATSSLIATRDTSFGELRLGAGGQLTRPVNLDGAVSASSFIVYSTPVELFEGVKLNVNMSGGAVFARSLSLINDAKNVTDNYTLTPALTVSSNISENLDFTVSARTAYNIVNNSLQPTQNNNFFTHTVNVRLNYVFWEGFFVGTDFNYAAYIGLAGGFNQSIPLLNASAGKRFLNNLAELKLSVFDALNVNTSVTRNVASGYVEDVQTAVLRRYLLLTFTYNFRAFGV
jgi:hypothetical protein